MVAKTEDLRSSLLSQLDQNKGERQINIDEIFTGFINFPASFDDVKSLLEAAGFKIFPPLKIDNVGFVPTFTAVINQLRMGFGWSADVIVSIHTLDIEIESPVTAIYGDIFTSFL